MDLDNGTVNRDPGGNSTRQRWWLHLVLLGSYPVAVGVLPELLGGRADGTLLPRDTAQMLTAMGFELVIFAVIFGAAWYASRANSDQLLLRWHDGAKPVFRGILYSILLRIAIAALMLLVALAATVLGGTRETMEKMRPRTEVVVDPSAMLSDPVYFWLLLTFVSFVVGGLREELWRAGMLAGVRVLFPAGWRGFRRDLLAVTVAAVIFGLGHLPQGLGGAAVTAMLGIGLGVIMVYHNSIWEAVLAHGFFNATSFIMLYYLAQTQPELLPVP